MKKIVMLSVLCIFLTNLISAGMIIMEQPAELYVFGETLETSVKVTSTSEINNANFDMNLVCDDDSTFILRKRINLEADEEEVITGSIKLIRSFVENSSKNCQVQVKLGSDELLTNTFQISDEIDLELKSIENEISPGDKITVEGDAIKPNGDPVDGYITLRMENQGTLQTEISDTVRGGYFSIDFKLSNKTKSGESTIKVTVYEEDYEGEITNIGYAESAINIKQIPTKLEIEFSQDEFLPGETLQTKAVLYDQANDPIEDTVIITIKNNKNKIMSQQEVKTGTYVKYLVNNGEPPTNWSIIAFSNGLTESKTIQIEELKKIDINVENGSIIIENIGNIDYQDNVSIKLGDQNFTIPLNLKVGDTEEYVLTAPEGEYSLEISSKGESTDSYNVFLTGDSINIQKAQQKFTYVLKHPISWIFIIMVTGLALMFISRRQLIERVKKIKIPRRKPKTKETQTKLIPTKIKEISQPQKKVITEQNGNLIKTTNIAKMLLSIKGEKQKSTIVCMKLKNHEEVKSNIQGIKETSKKIGNLAERFNSFVYENKDSILFIFSPLKTKTFQNEKSAIEFSERLKEIIKEHNRIFKQKIEYGVCLNSGDMIVKINEKDIEFSSLDNLIPFSKRIADFSDKEALLTQKFKNSVTADIKTERIEKDNITFYRITEIKNKEDHSKFINDFVSRNFKR